MYILYYIYLLLISFMYEENYVLRIFSISSSVYEKVIYFTNLHYF